MATVAEPPADHHTLAEEIRKREHDRIEDTARELDAESKKDPPPILTNVDVLRETVRQLNWGVRAIENTLSRVITHVVPALDRLTAELQLHRKGTISKPNGT